MVEDIKRQLAKDSQPERWCVSVSVRHDQGSIVLTEDPGETLANVTHHDRVSHSLTVIVTALRTFPHDHVFCQKSSRSELSRSS